MEVSYLLDLIGGIVVFWATTSRFNQPPPVLGDDPPDSPAWKTHVRNFFRTKTASQQSLFQPSRANTTAFSYRLCQVAYALLALVLYVLMLKVEGVAEQFQEIISWFADRIFGEDTKLEGAFVIAAFVVLILPYLPPFRWADIAIRKSLYLRARIPAQQLREMARLKRAPYQPPAEIMASVCKSAWADGFARNDIAYDHDKPTTGSLWCKCALLMEQIEAWQADDRYKTAFAILHGPDGNQRSVDEIKSAYDALISDAKTYFQTVLEPAGEDSEALQNRETQFRRRCKELLEQIYGLLSRVSLHAHYSDRERIDRFGEIGFSLNADPGGPVPNANDLIVLGVILGVLLVGPLALIMPVPKAVMIGCIMFSAVLVPVWLAVICPGVVNRKSSGYAPDVLYPVASGILAIVFGIVIIMIGSMFVQIKPECGTNGWMWYTGCSYPWSALHGSIAALLAWRMRMGTYPQNIQLLKGLARVRAFGDLRDGLICMIGMMLVARLVVLPLLGSLEHEKIFEGLALVRVTLMPGVMGFTLGFLLPTWYRANQARSNQHVKKPPYDSGNIHSPTDHHEAPLSHAG